MKLIFSVVTLTILFFHPLQPSIMPSFNHNAIFVVDMKQSNEFYEKVMQFKKIDDPFHDGKHTWYAIGPHAQLHVIEGARKIISHDVNVHMAFTVESLQSFVSHLNQLNIKYSNFDGSKKEVQNRPDGVQQIYLQDPDGYWIEVNNDRY